ncbi:hypothetical protein DXG03_003554 [Asterophora parasitica]|uniref:NAD(P)-binding protein n=1 Tax=Asterophora parasitica TaxID=117018 RepID=A0A9P7KAQ6_9AGAR|nr:hypothetical protein DXG03_003554 [Asterophora parasitica]
MPSYVVTGASRGLGLEFTTTLLDAGHTVIAIVRNKKAVSKGLTSIIEVQKYPKLHVLEADLEDQGSLERAATETAAITGGSLDVLINNAAHQAPMDKFVGTTLEECGESLSKYFKTNVLGPIATTNAFLPLLRKGTTKKVATLCSVLGVPDVTLQTEFTGHAAYSVTKSMLDMVNVKFALALRDEGFTFLGISPGVVWTEEEPPTEHIRALVEAGSALYYRLYPDWEGPFGLTAAESIAKMLAVLDNLQFVVDLLARGDTVVALARTPEKAAELQAIKDNKNLHILKADITDIASLQAAAEATAKLTNGAIDVLINNAVYQDETYSYYTLVDFPSPEALHSDFTTSFNTNVLGPIHTTNAFLPLLRKGTEKKVITLDTGLAIPDLTLSSGYPKLTAYSISKSALDMVNVKYALALRGEGFKFLALSPGVVNTRLTPPSEAELKEIIEMGGYFAKQYPTWTGPITPKESVAALLTVIDNLTIEQSGQVLSHKGNREFL